MNAYMRLNRGKSMKKRRNIFGIGLSKTGTTSHFAALSVLVYLGMSYRHMRDHGLPVWFNGDVKPGYFSDFEVSTAALGYPPSPAQSSAAFMGNRHIGLHERLVMAVGIPRAVVRALSRRLS